jgi:hypothetical protein
VRIDVFTVSGQRVATLVNRVNDPGIYSVPFDLQAANRRLGAGIYMIQLSAGVSAASCERSHWNRETRRSKRATPRGLVPRGVLSA